MEFFPQDGYRRASFQVFHSAGDLHIPSLLHRLVSTFKTVQQSIG